MCFLTRSDITAAISKGGRVVGEISTRECLSTRECQGASLKRWLAALAAAAAGLWVTTAAVANDDDDALPQCQELQVPVSLAQVPGASLYGELCVPAKGRPSAVQLLVHGATTGTTRIGHIGRIFILTCAKWSAPGMRRST